MKNEETLKTKIVKSMPIEQLKNKKKDLHFYFINKFGTCIFYFLQAIKENFILQN
jgi:hypothetical protein